jgi:hypothetical protein
MIQNIGTSVKTGKYIHCLTERSQRAQRLRPVTTHEVARTGT